MNLEKRLRELERTMGATAITLRMPDGSTRVVSSRRLLHMVSEFSSSGALPADTAAVLDSVSDNCLESGCGRMIEVIKALAAGAAQMAELDSAQIAALDATE
jgi:hypothetical protein